MVREYGSNKQKGVKRGNKIFYWTNNDQLPTLIERLGLKDRYEVIQLTNPRHLGSFDVLGTEMDIANYQYIKENIAGKEMDFPFPVGRKGIKEMIRDGKIAAVDADMKDIIQQYGKILDETGNDRNSSGVCFELRWNDPDENYLCSAFIMLDQFYFVPTGIATGMDRFSLIVPSDLIPPSGAGKGRLFFTPMTSEEAKKIFR